MYVIRWRVFKQFDYLIAMSAGTIYVAYVHDVWARWGRGCHLRMTISTSRAVLT